MPSRPLALNFVQRLQVQPDTKRVIYYEWDGIHGTSRWTIQSVIKMSGSRGETKSLPKDRLEGCHLSLEAFLPEKLLEGSYFALNIAFRYLDLADDHAVHFQRLLHRCRRLHCSLVLTRSYALQN